MSGPYFAAFCLALSRQSGEGPRIGFTLPRAFGKAVKRNRAKRRIREALRLRLTGYARNLADGTVEVLACGDAAALDELQRWLRIGPPAARVENVARSEAEEFRSEGFVTR